MFALDWVELKDFKSYHGVHRVTLPTSPGLYLLTGKNIANPRLATNGIGKTTLLDALHWAIYGRTSRGLSAGRVVAWGAKNASVTAICTVAGKRHEIKRTQSPNSLTLNGKPSTQDEITKLLRMNEQAFHHAIMFPQFGLSFFDLKPADKLALFTQVLELDFWLDKAQQAADIAVQVELQKVKTTTKRANLEGQIHAARDSREDLRARCGAFGREIDENTRRLREKLSEAQKEARFLEKRQKESEAALKQAKKRLLDQSLKCATCGQPLPESPDQAGLRRNINDFELDIKANSRKLDIVHHEVARLGEALKAEPNRENPYASLLQAQQSSLESLQTDLACLKTHIEHLEREYAAVNFWVGGFKRIRLMIVDEVLRLLEVEVNNNLSSLGLGDWSIKFDVERETKSGSISKGFVVMISSPEWGEPVPFEAWSGGETQRLRMAGDLGLANLIMERAGLENTIEFFDEPSSHMSQEGLLDLCDTLAQRAQRDDKVIILVDHHAIDFGDFAGVITVTKDEGGSHVYVGPQHL